MNSDFIRIFIKTVDKVLQDAGLITFTNDKVRFLILGCLDIASDSYIKVVCDKVLKIEKLIEQEVL